MLRRRKPEASADALHARLAAQVNELADATRAGGGHVSAEALAEVRRLAELAQLQRELAPARRRRRWIVASLLAVTLGIVSVLLVARVHETGVELDLFASELRFTVDTPQQLTETQHLTALGASGLVG